MACLCRSPTDVQPTKLRGTALTASPPIGRDLCHRTPNLPHGHGPQCGMAFLALLAGGVIYRWRCSHVAHRGLEEGVSSKGMMANNSFKPRPLRGLARDSLAGCGPA